jgi:DNA-binding IclR family transcriptional regulator
MLQSMTNRVESGLRAVRAVAERADPTAAIGVGAIAAELGTAVSSASRLCAELETIGLLERAPGHGVYRLGPAAIALSGRAAGPVARAVRFALVLAAQQTGETACIAAGSGDRMRIIDAVDSAWTLHAPARVGERMHDPAGALRLAAEREESAEPRAESVRSAVIEVAEAVRAPSGDGVAVLAVRLPRIRSATNLPRARHAVATARRAIEAALEAAESEVAREAAAHPPGRLPALGAALLVLEHLAAGPDTAAGVARSTGLRVDRVQRLLDSCERAGAVSLGADRAGYRLDWGAHGWFRAAAEPTMVARGTPHVAAAAAAAGASGFLTVLRGVRSFTLVEQLVVAGEGLAMLPWLGRLHPIIGSDGGPTLAMDFGADDLPRLLPNRHAPREIETLIERVRTVQRDGVLAIVSIEEAGQLSVSAPVRDASGSVVAAACLVGSYEVLGPRRAQLERAALALAAAVTAELRSPASFGDTDGYPS